MNFHKREILVYRKEYRVDKQGNVISPKNVKRKLQLNGDRFKFNCRIKHKVVSVKVHRLQAYQKFGDKIFKKGQVVRHLNRNPLDNSWQNIDIGTQSDNMMDVPEIIRKNRSAKANKKYCHKQIVSDRESGMTYKEIMEKHNIKSKGTVSFIINKNK